MPGTSTRLRRSCLRVPTCKYCGGTEFTKETDIMDVWFDSGVTHASVLMDRLGKWPCRPLSGGL